MANSVHGHVGRGHTKNSCTCILSLILRKQIDSFSTTHHLNGLDTIKLLVYVSIEPIGFKSVQLH